VGTTKTHTELQSKAVLAATPAQQTAPPEKHGCPMRRVFATRGGSTAEELLDGLQQVFDTLGATDHPPEEWKPWLEPLMKVTQDGKTFDLKALLDTLSSLDNNDATGYSKGTPP